jgi:threonylcarbamoyladenosine tRNA methylthiotransferase MtaB
MIHRAKKKNPDSVVAAVGCYVESGGKELMEDGAIDVMFSNKEKSGLAEKMLEYLKENGKATENAEKRETKLYVPEKQTESGRTRKYIKIQDGCNQFCTYCMIPYVRGGGVLSSRQDEDVLAEAEEAAKRGCKEVVLTGIHLSSYGVDRTEEKQFVALKGKPLVCLLQKMDKIEGIRRIRLGSLEPRIISEEFLEGLKKVTKLCPHFHLSLQSGCDTVLKRMNRHYTAVEYKEKCDLLRKYYENPAITTDIIVGFPGETEEEFQATCEFVQEVELADIHVFPYSVRSGTKAAQMPNQVSAEKKHERSEILIGKTERLKQKYRESFLGRDTDVLLEEVREIDGIPYLTGHNERYVPLKVPVCETTQNGYGENQIVRIKVEQSNFVL